MHENFEGSVWFKSNKVLALHRFDHTVYIIISQGKKLKPLWPFKACLSLQSFAVLLSILSLLLNKWRLHND